MVIAWTDFPGGGGGGVGGAQKAYKKKQKKWRPFFVVFWRQ